MSLKMMPPKKSKAARSECEDKPEPVPEHSDSPKEKEKVPEKEESVTDDTPKKPFNVFDVIIVDGKRKRPVIHTPETLLDSWCGEYLVEKEGVRLPLTELYNIYLDKCMSDFSTAVEPFFFNKVLRKRFPDGYAFKPSSQYEGKIKEKKIPKKGETKVKAGTLTMKIRDIIHNSLTDMGNPRGGVRFNRVLGFIAGKYPALRLDVRPKVLLTALQRGVKFGYLTCDRGIGKCGFYRLYVENEPEEPEKPKENGKEKDDADEKTDGGGDTEGEKDGEKSGDESESKPKTEKTNGEKTDEGEKTSKKKAVKKRVPKDRFIHHGDPVRLEDTFYLAMTFMSEPKEASVVRIKKYVAENYSDANVDKLAKCLEVGKERGYWEQVSGTSGSSGRFRLEVDSFDPTDDEDMTGMVINAIMACTEPKVCSSNLLKKYVMEWYADKFKVAERPYLFKKALERAVANQEIKQLSGIGASGTFQLVKTFHPSPVILAGQDTTSDYDEVKDTSDEEAIESYDFSGYGDKYKPRPSKRRGMARSKAVSAKPAIEINEDRNQKRKRKVVKRVMKKTHRRGESDSDDSSDDESSNETTSDSEAEAPPPKKNRAAGASGRSAPPAKKVAAKRTVAKKTPAKKIIAKKTPVKKTTGRKTAGKRTTGKRSSANHGHGSSDSSEDEKATTPSRRSAGKRLNYAVDSDSDNSAVGERRSDGYKPTPSRSRGGVSARPDPESAKDKASARKPSKRGGKKPQQEEENEEMAPLKTPVRTPAAKKQGDDKMYSSDSDSVASEIPIPKIETLAAKKQRSVPVPTLTPPSKAKGSRGKRRR